MDAKVEKNQLEVAKVLNNIVLSALTNSQIQGFERAYLIANAVGELKALLTSEYMRPIMNLQGNRLGFKTDRDIAQGGGKGLGYPEDVVKNCLIEAVLYGLQPTGNQFNIIAGNMYATKEGCGYLLSKLPGLDYRITPQLPRIKEESAAIVMSIEWTIGTVSKTQNMDIPIRVNKFMGTDAVIGKATRKARKWLYDTITGVELPEGDIQDADATVVSSKVNDTPAIEDLQLLFENKKALLTPEELGNAERIISNQEQNSYSKLLKLLQSK